MKRPQFLRFRLRTLFVLLFVSAVALGVYARWLHGPRVVAALGKQGIQAVTGDDQWLDRDNNPTPIPFFGKTSSCDGRNLSEINGLKSVDTDWRNVPQSLLAYCAYVRCITASNSKNSRDLLLKTQLHPRLTFLSLGSDLSDSDLDCINPNIEFLRIQAPISDKGMKGVGRLSRLKWFRIDAPLVTHAGIAELQGCPELRYLCLGDTSPMSDEILPVLAKLSKLRQVEVWQCRISVRGLLTIRSEHPSLESIFVQEDDISFSEGNRLYQDYRATTRADALNELLKLPAP